MALNIILPFEQEPNSYVTPGLCFMFNYFAIRKMHFLLRAKALVCFPGGFGTLDELFTALTLKQTGRMQDVPIILYSKEYWDGIINFQFLADEGVIQDQAHASCFNMLNLLKKRGRSSRTSTTSHEEPLADGRKPRLLFVSKWMKPGLTPDG